MDKLVVVLLLAGCGGNHKGGDDMVSQDDAAVHDGTVGDGPVDAPPDGQVTSMMIGTAGGTVTTPDGVVLVIPSGALAVATNITITVVTDAEPSNVVSKIYALEPDGTQFSAPVTLTLPYDPALLGATSETDLALASLTGTTNAYAGSGWALIDGARHTATGYITHFSEWAIVPAPPNNCTVNYGCMKLCSGAEVPEICCSDSRNTCRAGMSTSFPAYVRCYSQCIGTPQVANFGNSACMSSCCTGQGWSVKRHGACYMANGSAAEAQAILACSRSCFGAADQNEQCPSGNPQSDACIWQFATPGIGGECDANMGNGLVGVFLYTGVHQVYDQFWQNPPFLHITGGSLSSTSLSIPLSCASTASISGTLTGTWSGSQYDGTFTFGTRPDGTFTLTPAWPLTP